MQTKVTKLFSIVAVILSIIIFSSCSFSKQENSNNGSNNLPNEIEPSSQTVEDTSSNISYQNNEKKLTSIKKEDYDGELNVDGKNSLTNRQKLIIQSIINSLSEAHIIYKFNSIDDIKSTDFPTYLGFRCKYFFDISLDEELNSLLNYNQVLTILKSDFGITTAPKWLEEKKSEIIKSPFSSQGNNGEIISINQKENTIIVIAKMYPTPVHDSLEKETLPNTLKYTFETNDKGGIILKSGELTKV